jgi:Flp pilus assembly protein TadG
MNLVHIRQRAVSTLTFALIAPVFLFVLFGTMEIGRVLHAWMVITNEARETARRAAVNFDGTADPLEHEVAQEAAARAYLAQRLDGVLAPSGLYPLPQVDFLATGTNQSPRVQVTIYYHVPLVVPIIEQLLPDPFPLKAQSGMRGE